MAPNSLSTAVFADLNQSFDTYKTPTIEDDEFITEIIQSKDPRSHTPEMQETEQDEIINLIKRGTFKVILKKEVPPDANILPGRFVLALKSTVVGTVKHKARFLIGGHRDKLKFYMVHSSQTLQPASIRLLLALETFFGFEIWTADVTQAYLQSTIPLSRDLFLNSFVPELHPHVHLSFSHGHTPLAAY